MLYEIIEFEGNMPLKNTLQIRETSKTSYVVSTMYINIK